MQAPKTGSGEEEAGSAPQHSRAASALLAPGRLAAALLAEVFQPNRTDPPPTDSIASAITDALQEAAAQLPPDQKTAGGPWLSAATAQLIHQRQHLWDRAALAVTKPQLKQLRHQIRRRLARDKRALSKCSCNRQLARLLALCATPRQQPAQRRRFVLQRSDGSAVTQPVAVAPSRASQGGQSPCPSHQPASEPTAWHKCYRAEGGVLLLCKRWEQARGEVAE